MDDCPHGQQPHKCETCEVTAERDRLRAVVQTALGIMLKHMVDCHNGGCEKCAAFGEMYPHLGPPALDVNGHMGGCPGCDERDRIIIERDNEIADLHVATDPPDHEPNDVGPWHCGFCGQTSPECRCGDPLLMIIRTPDLTADMDDHDLAARGLVDMINAQRHENWVCGSGDPEGERPVRLLASAWRAPQDAGALTVDRPAPVGSSAGGAPHEATGERRALASHVSPDLPAGRGVGTGNPDVPTTTEDAGALTVDLPTPGEADSDG